MAAGDKSGIYQIKCVGSRKRYVGSSVQIYRRWYQHRKLLKAGKHTSPYLQKSWDKYGADAFLFSIIEECSVADLEVREQHYIDTLRPEFNSVTNVRSRIGPVPRAKMAESLRARAAKITHCPRGHEYTPENTYRNAKGKRICRACNALRVKGVYAAETPEQREARRQRVKADYEANREIRNAAARIYLSTRKAEKAEYDRQRRAAAKAKGDPSKWSKMTPEQKASRNAKRRADYQKKEAPACLASTLSRK